MPKANVQTSGRMTEEAIQLVCSYAAKYLLEMFEEPDDNFSWRDSNSHLAVIRLLQEIVGVPEGDRWRRWHRYDDSDMERVRKLEEQLLNGETWRL